MLTVSILFCDNCGESYDALARGHDVCDAWKVEAHKAKKFIESQGYGHLTKYFNKDQVLNLLINYKDAITKP